MLVRNWLALVHHGFWSSVNPAELKLRCLALPIYEQLRLYMEALVEVSLLPYLHDLNLSINVLVSSLTFFCAGAL